MAAPTAAPTPGSPKMAPTPAPPPAPTPIAGPTPYFIHPRFMARLAYGTILEMGISTMSVAPRSRRAGMRMLISLRGTTVSTA